MRLSLNDLVFPYQKNKQTFLWASKAMFCFAQVSCFCYLWYQNSCITSQFMPGHEFCLSFTYWSLNFSSSVVLFLRYGIIVIWRAEFSCYHSVKIELLSKILEDGCGFTLKLINLIRLIIFDDHIKFSQVIHYVNEIFNTGSLFLWMHTIWAIIYDNWS